MKQTMQTMPLLQSHYQLHSAGAHSTQTGATAQPQPPPITARVEKVRRPTVNAAGSSEDWAYFVTSWQENVEATKLEGRDLIIQLLECCEEQLRKDLTRNEGALSLTKLPTKYSPR